DGAHRVERLFLVHGGRTLLRLLRTIALGTALLRRCLRAHRQRDEDEGRDPHGLHQGALSFDPPSGASGCGLGSGFTGWTRFSSCRFAGGMSRSGGEVSDCEPVTSGPFCSGGGGPPSDSHAALAVSASERAASLRMSDKSPVAVRIVKASGTAGFEQATLRTRARGVQRKCAESFRCWST